MPDGASLRRSTLRASSVQALAQEAELVALRVRQHMPRLVAGLPHVVRPGAQCQQPLQLRLLPAVHRVDVNVQRQLPRPRIRAGAQDDRGLQAAESLRRSNLDGTVLPAKFHIPKDIAPEAGEQLGVGAVQDKFADSA